MASTFFLLLLEEARNTFFLIKEMPQVIQLTPEVNKTRPHL